MLDKIIAGAPDEAAGSDRDGGHGLIVVARALPWAVAGALAVALAAALWAPWRSGSAPASGTALRLTPLAFEPGGQIGAVWSPDGKAVAYGARQKDTDPYQVYVRYLDSPVATPITAPELRVQGVIQWTTARQDRVRDGTTTLVGVPGRWRARTFEKPGVIDPTLQLVGNGLDFPGWRDGCGLLSGC